MTTNTILKQRFFWLAVVALGGILLIQTMLFDAAADSKPYSVSLNSAVTFPVDI